MAETKQLVLVVEGTDALRPHWPTIVSNYLEKVIRSYCGTDNQKELALVIFNNHEARNSLFLFFLSSTGDIPFGAAATAEGLSEALMMFPYVNGFQNGRLEKHCILVAASNPYPHPTPVYTPPCFIPPHYKVMKTGNLLCDAETVAKSFSTSFVSLSVISPWRNIPKLEAIYNAANGLLPKTGRNIRIMTNPENLVLISEHFIEARLALSQPEITKVPPKRAVW
ncbi:hypothetical protein L2E82_43196 [Cichorium intybus]|uniref:Uncharacterized protein n=1 Tax=Cichorium intybus TaxID=13427 RepID=A0ACB8ZME3_CICIN|nr:hypothetical protein L2E82_43196 [Cichorium intybus]